MASVTENESQDKPAAPTSLREAITSLHEWTSKELRAAKAEDKLGPIVKRFDTYKSEASSTNMLRTHLFNLLEGCISSFLLTTKVPDTDPNGHVLPAVRYIHEWASSVDLGKFKPSARGSIEDKIDFLGKELQRREFSAEKTSTSVGSVKKGGYSHSDHVMRALEEKESVKEDDAPKPPGFLF